MTFKSEFGIFEEFLNNFCKSNDEMIYSNRINKSQLEVLQTTSEEDIVNVNLLRKS